MFEIQLGPSGQVVMTGRLDASQCDAALRFLETVAQPRVIDLAGLEYVASSGLRVSASKSTLARSARYSGR